MSPWSDWKDIVWKFLKAHKDPEKLKTFYNTILGETWEIHSNNGLEEAVLEILSSKKFRNPGVRIVVEASLEQDFSFLEGTPFQIEKVKAYKTNKHLFIRLAED